ncbi:acyl-CoA dehydrogenase family protein [Sphingomonas sp. MMS24-JH45]
MRDSNKYVVNGQKIWTSEAHYSEWLFLLVRTSTAGKPQAGISFLLVDMATPGITVRPIISIDGGHVLNEVFLEDVRVPATNLIGEENAGWTYAKHLLGAERTFSAEVPRLKGQLARVKHIAARTRVRDGFLIGDAHFVRRLAQLEIEVLAHEATLWRVVAEEEADVPSAAPTSSILKIRRHRTGAADRRADGGGARRRCAAGLSRKTDTCSLRRPTALDRRWRTA